MMGLDTNVLVRAATNDDAVHSPKARAIIAGLTPGDPAVINAVVLVEFAWTMRGYGYRRNEIVAAIEKMLQSPCYVAPNRGAINAALVRCQSEGLDFADALIGELSLEAGCGATLTLDQGCLSSTALRPVT